MRGGIGDSRLVMGDPGSVTRESRATVIPNSESRPYFTPCMRRWISGAIRNNSAPGMTSAQKPNV